MGEGDSSKKDQQQQQGATAATTTTALVVEAKAVGNTTTEEVAVVGAPGGEEERGIITRNKGFAPLWSTPQLDTFIKEVDALKDGMLLNLKRIREIDEEVQSRKDLLIKKARSMLVADLEEETSNAANQQTQSKTPPPAEKRGHSHSHSQPQPETAPPNKDQDKEAIALEFYDLITRSENKFHIASQTYDLADMHTCRLDKALKSLEDELRAQRRMASLYDATTSAGATTGGRGRGGSNQNKARNMKNKKVGKLKGNHHNNHNKQQSLGLGLGTPIDPIQSAVAPMVVDPSEPTYCYCNRVSFGQMVGCDNDDCLWEWFHIGCVGIWPHNMPKGKWFCPECRKLKKG